MRKLILSTVLGVSIGLLSIKPCEAQVAQNLENEVAVSEVKEAIDYLASDELAGRETGTEGIEKAANFIENKFKEYGVRPYFETYRDSFQVNEHDAFNIVGVVEGTDEELKEEFIIIGAHYDHIGSAKPVNGDELANGANDNATGTVAVIQLAKHFGMTGGNKRSIMFVLFSAEEMGLKGSEHLAKLLNSQNLDLYTMVNIEMIGVPMKAKDYMAYITGYENSNLADKFNEYSEGKKVLGFLPQAQQMNLFKRSDNYPFYEEFGVPSQTLCTFDFSNYPYYHHVDDEAELMDAEHMANLIEHLIPGLRHMASTAEKEIKLNVE